MISSKKQLAIALSRLQSFEKPSVRLEQYPTDSEIAAEILWFADQLGDIKGKVIADFGCGTGILGIGAMMFSPAFVHFVDIDEMPLRKLKENLQLMGIEKGYDTLMMDIGSFSRQVDVILENPPFGIKSEHADRKFLEKAFRHANVIYSFHKLESQDFIGSISKDNGFKITHFFRFEFPLKNTMSFHTKKIQRIEVGCWRLERNKV